MLKQIIIFAAGLLTGGGSAVLYFKKTHIKTDIHEKEIDDMRRYYEKKSGEIRPRRTVSEDVLKNKQSGPDIQVEPLKYVKPEVVDYDKKFVKNKKDVKEDPAESEHPTENDEYEEDYSLGLAAKKEREAALAKDKGPKIIKASEFGSESYLDTITLLYYMEDDILTNEDEEVYEDLDEVEAMLGDTLHKYGFDHNQESSIYVRNVKRGEDYEIIKVFSSFNDK
jgi:hypothetical protein